MEQFFAEYLKILETLHNEIAEALDGLPEEAANWSPAGDSNSLVVLAIQAAGAERYWIGDVAADGRAFGPRPRRGVPHPRTLAPKPRLAHCRARSYMPKPLCRG